MVKILIGVIIIIYISVITFLMFLLARNNLTYKNRIKISNAIYKYNIDMIAQNKYDNILNYGCLESYDETLHRLWDFGCENIVPKDVYELIKDYIEE